MKKLVHKLIDRAGYQLLNKKYMPCGINISRDMARDIDISTVKTIFDVGANIGNMSLNFFKNFDESQIYAFEPIQNTFSVLRKRTASFSRIKCYQIAFSDRKKNVEVFLQNDSGLNSLNGAVNLRCPKSNNDSEIVAVTTVGDFCVANEIDYIDMLKTDTEGLDLNVLRGAEPLLESQKIRYVLSEVTFDAKNNRNTQFVDVQSYLENFGFKLRSFYDQSDFGKKSFMTGCNALFFKQM